jgi:hypothetical protein
MYKGVFWLVTPFGTIDRFDSCAAIKKKGFRREKLSLYCNMESDRLQPIGEREPRAFGK